MYLYFIVALAASLVITVIAERILIPILKSVKMEQKILEIGPRWHKSKENTPTMGGITLTSGYTYTKSSDTSASLTINSVTGDVAISCTATGDIVGITINVYLDNELDKTVSSEIRYPSNSTVNELSVRVAGWVGGRYATYAYDNSGSGTGYTWNTTLNTSAKLLEVTTNITWGTVASSIIIDIYGISDTDW